MGFVRLEETTGIVVFGSPSDHGVGYTHSFKGLVCKRDSAEVDKYVCDVKLVCH